MKTLPKKIVDEFDKLKAESSSRLVLKVIRENYYVYKERGVWLKDKHCNKTISEYIGKITEDGLFVRKSFHARNDLESAKALIAEHGGEITWHATENENITETDTRNLNADKIDLSILMSLSMNARLPVSRIAELAGINEQTAYSRIRALEKRFGIKYSIEFDMGVLGFTTYLIMVKFEHGVPEIEEMRRAFQSEPKVQFAAITKGDYDVIAYMLDEDSVKAEDDLWKLMSETSLKTYDARWHMIPFGQVYSSVPLRDEFIERILKQRQWHRGRFITITPTQEDILKREFFLMKELNNNATMDFSDIDKKYKLGRGASRYTYQQLKAEGIITRPTITMGGIQLRHLGMILIETENPKKVSETRFSLLLKELEYEKIMNKYVLIGNISMPEGSVLVMPSVEEGDLEMATASLNLEVKGVTIRTLVVSATLVGSMYYRRFDNNYSRQYSTLMRHGKTGQSELIEYE